MFLYYLFCDSLFFPLLIFIPTKDGVLGKALVLKWANDDDDDDVFFLSPAVCPFSTSFLRT